MTGALLAFGYALAAAWLVPPPLARLAGRGASPRAALAAWLVAMASVALAATLGLVDLVRTAVADWPQLTVDLCRSVAGQACTPEVCRGALYSTGVSVLAAVLTLAAGVALGRYGRRLRRGHRQTRAHAEIARIDRLLHPPRAAELAARATALALAGAALLAVPLALGAG